MHKTVFFFSCLFCTTRQNTKISPFSCLNQSLQLFHFSHGLQAKHKEEVEQCANVTRSLQGHLTASVHHSKGCCLTHFSADQYDSSDPLINTWIDPVTCGVNSSTKAGHRKPHPSSKVLWRKHCYFHAVLWQTCPPHFVLPCKQSSVFHAVRACFQLKPPSVMFSCMLLSSCEKTAQ